MRKRIYMGNNLESEHFPFLITGHDVSEMGYLILI